MGLEGRSGGEKFHRAWKAMMGLEGRSGGEKFHRAWKAMMRLEGRSGGERFHRAWKAMMGLEGLTLDGTVNPLATVLMSRECVKSDSSPVETDRQKSELKL